MARPAAPALCRILVLAAVLFAGLLRPLPIQAQTDPSLDNPPPPWGDLASDEDPSLRPDDPQFELPLDPYTGSPAFLDPPAGDQLDVVPPGGDPTSLPSSPAGDVTLGGWAPVTCTGVQPLRLAALRPRYFSYWGSPVLLGGVSADSGCVLNLAETDQCNVANYTTVLQAAHDLGLNKIRVWVGMGFGYDDIAASQNPPKPAIPLRLPNAPFLWVTPATGAPYWLLDSQAAPVAGFPAFFDRLRAVVDAARAQKLYVEVTFFSPFEGSAFNSGPWSKPGGLSRAADPAGSANLAPAGFSSPFYAVTNDTTSSAAIANEKMRAYQANIIKWTVDTLWCYDNVYWEIANEPEGQAKDVDLIQKAADPLAVTKWQKSMIYEVRKAEKAHSPQLVYGHLIAVQPFTSTGATALLTSTTPPPGWQPDPNFPLDPQVLNGHYTNVVTNITGFPTGQIKLDSGAMDFVRNATYNKRNLPVGFNETAITNLGGARGTKRHLNGPNFPSWGTEEAARAEAWEYFFSGGSAYDHFGYLGKDQLPNLNATATAIRRQLGLLLSLFNLKKFDLGSPLPELTDFVTATQGHWFSPGGLTNPGVYRLWEPRTSSQRYWAALEVPGKNALLFYLHHSTPRCKTDTDVYNQGCPNNVFTPFGSYDARVWTVAPPAGGPAGYQETFTLLSGTYTVSWINPETALPFPGSPQIVTCSGPCAITSPVYKFDIFLKLVRH